MFKKSVATVAREETMNEISTIAAKLDRIKNALNDALTDLVTMDEPPSGVINELDAAEERLMAAIDLMCKK